MKCPKCHRPLVDEDDGPYICCADAPMQWQCESCGKVSEGFAFPYGRCPQCGGELALRAPQEAHPDAASLTAVRMAFEIELGGRAFYQRAAADSHDETLRSLFGRFAVMEGEHMETLSRRYHIEAPDVSENFRIELAAIFGEVESRPQDPANLFRIAIALEKRAAEFFASCADKAPAGSPEALLYKELAAEERDHASILTTEYTRWKDDKPGIFSGDPLVDAAHAARQPGAALVALNAAAVLLDGHEPGRIALVCGDQEISYAELRNRVARAAAVWRSRGLVPGDRVAIKLCDGIDWVVAFLGTIWAGGVAVAVNPHIPATEWRYILDEAGFNVIVAETTADTPEPWKQRVILVDEGRRAVAAAEPIPPRLVDEDTPAFWVHSSGTSGKPKAVVHAHRFVREIERISRERIGITKDDRLFASSRLFFSYPQTNSLYAGLKIGATVILDPRWPTAETVAETVAAMRPSVLFCVPSLYRNLLHAGLAPKLAAAGVRRCVSAGEPLPASLREAWREACGIAMVDGYGASETLVLVLTALDGDDGLYASPGVELHAVDPAAAASGVPTRLCFRAPSISLGYLDRPAAQADSFRDGAFCPADLFVPTDGGGWRFAGREDSLVKIKGRWVNLVELDERLAAGTPGLIESAAVILPDEDGVDAIAMFFVAAPDAAAGVERELRHRAASLPQYQRPKWLHCVEALPRTATGKLLRRKLVDLIQPAA